MKLNYKSCLTAATIAIVASNAGAGMITDWYMGATAGLGGMAVYIDKDNHRAFSAQSFGGVIGVDLPIVRFEAEYDYLNSKNTDANLVAGNAYVKLPAFISVNPYIGVGVGALFGSKSDSVKFKKFDTSIAYQGMLGATLDIPVLPFKIDVEGRALLSPDVYDKKNDSMAVQYDGRVKLRYIF